MVLIRSIKFEFEKSIKFDRDLITSTKSLVKSGESVNLTIANPKHIELVRMGII